MLASEQLVEYAKFNLWANRQMVNWLENQPEEFLNRHTPSSFPSLAETFVHIWGAEYLWMKRVNGESVADFPRHPYNGSVAEMMGKLLACSAEYLANLQNREEGWFHEALNYRTLAGVEYVSTRLIAMHHCINHSTFHRGQLVTMGRALGLTNPPATDFMA